MLNGYFVKVSVSFGLYYLFGSVLYYDMLVEFWFVSEEVV